MFVVASLAISAGCGSEAGPPDTQEWTGPCPATNEGIHTEILTPMCGSSGCHGVSAPALYLDLVSAGLNQRLVGVSASGCGDKVFVAAGDPARSYLTKKMTQVAPTFVSARPRDTKVGSVTDKVLSIRSVDELAKLSSPR